MVKIILSLKTVYTIVAVFVSFLLIGIGVYAYSGTAPTTVGHGMGELMPSCSGMLVGASGVANSWTCVSASIPTCTGAEQGLTWTGSAWECNTLS
jgi:hypothetical protein